MDAAPTSRTRSASTVVRAAASHTRLRPAWNWASRPSASASRCSCRTQLIEIVPSFDCFQQQCQLDAQSAAVHALHSVQKPHLLVKCTLLTAICAAAVLLLPRADLLRRRQTVRNRVIACIFYCRPSSSSCTAACCAGLREPVCACRSAPHAAIVRLLLA